MVLLALDSLLLFFITYFTGGGLLAIAGKWLRLPLQAGFMGIFLTGLAGNFIYFNLVSFVLPVDYKTLVLPLAAAVFVATWLGGWSSFYTQLVAARTLFFSRRNVPFTLAFLSILFIFWVIPPGNWDSGEYHYLSIRWYETYKVVPGLANLHSRLAFNPANFIISAPYTFSAITGQALYPLNGVIALLYFAWLLRLFLRTPFLWLKILLTGYAILQFRDMVLNISSPSSDLPVAVLVSYCGIETWLHLRHGSLTLPAGWVLLLLAAFGITAKLSAVPTLLLLPFLWIHFQGKKTAALFLKTAVVLALLWLPWLARNAIMSGYLLYPISGSNLVAFDWAVPKEVLLLDDFYTRYATRSVEMPHAQLATMNLLQLMKTWVADSLRHKTLSFLIAIAAFLIPPIMALYRKKTTNLRLETSLLPGIYYLAAVVWLVYSPEFRFGLCLLQLLIVLALWPLAAHNNTVAAKWLQRVPLVLLLATVAYFIRDYRTRLSNQQFQLTESWWLPARDYRYTMYDANSPFPYTRFANGTRLYLADSTHACMVAGLPCVSWRYGQIEMRGAGLQQGFRNVKNEVRKNFPFLP